MLYKDYNELCLWLNNKTAIIKVKAIEINANKNAQSTKCFATWFENLISITKLDSTDLVEYKTNCFSGGIKNIIIIEDVFDDVINKISNGLLEFVYVENSNKKLIIDWAKKIKKGCYLSGNDIKYLPDFIIPDVILKSGIWIAQAI